MKIFLLISGITILTSCSQLEKLVADNKAPIAKTKKVTSSKKVGEAKKSSAKPDINGTLNNGTLYEATPEEEGFVISFDPFIAKNDEVFFKATNQIIAKLYSDTVSDESHISIETDIDYTIYKGARARYKIVPFKESNGEISSISLSQL